MKRKILVLLLALLLTFTLTACDMLNNMGGGGGGGTTTVEVNLDEVYLNVQSQINTKDALTDGITLPTSFGSVTITWASENTNLIDNRGNIVTRPDEDTEVILNCTLTSAKEQKTYKLKVIIKAKDPEPVKELAHLPANLQGTYTGDGVTVIVSESSVTITDPSGTTLTFEIYVDKNEYFIEENGLRVYCTFENDTVTNSHGTFTKENGQTTQHDPVANLPESLQGTYKSGNITVIVSASSVVVMEEGNDQNTYVLYVDANNQYYVEEEGQKIVCTFGTDSVTNKFGTFTKDNGQQTTTISTLAEAKKAGVGQTCKVRAVVIAISNVSFLLQDDTDTMLVYLGTEYAKDLAIGDEVELEGAIGSYSNTIQFTTANYKKVGTKTVNTPTPRVLDAAALDALATTSTPVLEFVQLEGSLRISGNYMNIEVNGATAKGSLATNLDLSSMANKVVIVKGYYLYNTSSGKYANIIATSVELSANQEELTVSTIAEVLAGQVGKTYKIEATVVALCNGIVVVSDESGIISLNFSSNFDPSVLKLGDKLSIQGPSYKHGGAIQLNYPEYKVIGTNPVTHPELIELNAKTFDALDNDQITTKYVKLTGELVVSNDKYFNIIVDGSTLKGSIAYPTNADALKALDGHSLVVEGYFIYITTSAGEKYAYIVTTGLSDLGEALTIAHLPVTLQGTYKAEGLTVVVNESSVVVSEAEHGDHNYVLYVDADGSYYVLEEGEKIVCTFADNQVTNKFGTFIKDTSGEQTAPVHAGTKDDPYDAADAIFVATHLSSSQPTADKFYITGTIIDEPTADYCNFNFASGDKTLLAYGLSNANGTKRFGTKRDIEELPVKKGDVVVVCANIQNFNGQPEMVNAWIVSINGEEQTADPVVTPTGDPVHAGTAADPFDAADAILVASKQAPSTSAFTADKYYISGTIDDDPTAEYCNFSFAHDGNTILAYGLWTFDGTQRYGSKREIHELPVKKGDEVIVCANIQNYNGKYEMVNAWIVSINGVNLGEEGQEDELANLPESLQGTYKAEGLTVIVNESSVVVSEAEHGDHYYVLYVDADGSYYVLEEGEKVICTFGENQVTNKYGTFVKEEEQVHDPEADLPESLQGVYRNEYAVIEVWAGVVAVWENGNEEATFYIIYVDPTGQYYIESEDGKAVICTFEDGKVSNAFGIFIKDGSDEPLPEIIDYAELDESFHGIYENEEYRVIITTYTIEVYKAGSEDGEEYTICFDENFALCFEMGDERIYISFEGNILNTDFGTFTKSEEQLTDEYWVAKTKAGFEEGWTNIRTVMSVSLSEEANGCTLTWVSSNEDVLSSDGHVTLPDEETEVTLTLTITKGEVVDTLDIVITVLPASPISTILSLSEEELENSAYAVKGVVVAICDDGFLVKDSTGYILAYDATNFFFRDDLELGEEVVLRGFVKPYNGTLEFTGFFGYYATGETVDLEDPEFANLDDNLAARLSKNMEVMPIVLKGVLTIYNGKYINIALSDSSFIGSINGNVDEYADLENKHVIVKGYVISVNNQYVNIIPLGIEEDEEFIPTPGDKDNIVDGSTITKTFEVNEDGTWTVMFSIIASDQYESPRFVLRDILAFGFLNGEFNEELYLEESVILQDKSNLIITEDGNTITIKVIVPEALVVKYTSEYYAAAKEGTAKGGLYLDLYLEFYDGEVDYSPVENYYYGSYYFFRSFLDVVETSGDGTFDHPISAADARDIAAYLPAGIWTKDEFYIIGTVVGEPNAKYGNLALDTYFDTTLTVYGLYTNDGLYQYGTAAGRVEEIPVHDGDEVLLLAQIYHYVSDSGVSTLETKNAKLIKVNEDAVTYEALPEYRMIDITPLNGVKEGHVYYVEGYRNGQSYFGKFVEVEDGIIKCQVRYVCDSFRIFEYLQPEEGEEFSGYTRYTNTLGLDATECAFHGRDDLSGTKSFVVNEDGSWTVTMILEANEAIANPSFEVLDVVAFGYQNGVWDNSLYLEESVILNDKSNLVVESENGVLTVTITVAKELVAKYTSEYYYPDMDGTCYKGGIALDLYIKFFDGDIDLSYDNNYFGAFYYFGSFLDVVETTGDGTADNPLTAADAYALAAYLPAGVWTNDEYYIEGIVVSVDSAWCNLAFQVGEDTFLVYGIATADGEYKYGTSPNKVQGIPVKVDDKVLLLAQVYHYVKDGVSTLEAKDAKLILVNDEEVTYELVVEEEYETSHAGTADDPLDGADVALIASHLDATTKEQTEVRYYIEAVVAEVEGEPTSDYCNFHLVTGGEEVLVYGLAEDEAFTQRYGTKREIATLPEGLVAGNTVVLYGYIQNYSGTFEIQKAQLLKIVPAQGE